MKLIVAEKPSVAAVYAQVVGAKKQGGFWQNEEYLVTNGLGHLVELAEPKAIHPEWKAWDLDVLPMIPTDYPLSIQESTKRQFQLVKQLLNDGRVDTVICATDPDREGENIFRHIYELSGCQKPVQRLWVSSMEESAIREGLLHALPDSEYDNLADAALCREIADWVIGMNFTRLFSKKYSNGVLPVGRVKAPVTAMIVRREKEIASFKPTPYWTLTADFDGLTLTHKCEKEDDMQRLSQCIGQLATITEIKSEPADNAPPKLCTLTELSQLMNRYYGATAAQTEAAMQSLYERKLATYPRTESKYLTEGDRGLAESILKSALEKGLYHGELTFDLNRVINDEKVGGHPALMPTVLGLEKVSECTTLEQQIIYLLTFRLLEAAAPPRCCTRTAIKASMAGMEWSASSTLVHSKGWYEVVESKVACLKLETQQKAEEPEWTREVQNGETLTCRSVSTVQKMTQPPTRYTEATLLGAMKKHSLGTAATRGKIINQLIITSENSSGYLTYGTQANGKKKREDVKHLYPSEKACILTSILPPELTDPKTTGQWEEQLSDIQNGIGDAEQFIRNIEDYVRDVVNKEKESLSGPIITEDDSICECPLCSGRIIKRPMKKKGSFWFHCTQKDCKFSVFSPTAGKTLGEKDIKALCSSGRTEFYPFLSAHGKPFYACLCLNRETGTTEMSYTLCECPLCKEKIVSFGYEKDGTFHKGFKCSNRSCKLKWFFTPFCGREFSSAEVISLMTDGKTSSMNFTGKNGPYIASVEQKDGEYKLIPYPSKNRKGGSL